MVRLEENIAEKISRLGRTTTARDMYDLTWLVTHPRDIGDLDTEERQLAKTREHERHLALRLLNELPGARLASLGLY